MITGEQLGQRLRAARGAISQDVAAAELSIPRSAISNMESGTRQVSSIELTRLAALYGRPIEWFVSPNTQEGPADTVIWLLRQEPGLAEGEVRQQVTRVIQAFRDGRSLLRLLEREQTTALPRYELAAPRSTGAAIAQGQAVAEQERRRLELGNAPIRDLSDLIWAQGVWAATVDLPHRMAGLFVRGDDFGMAVLANATQVPGRRRFSLAHEYGHALMDRDQPPAVTQEGNRKDLREQRANAFAASFLMPAEGVREFLATLGKGHGSRREEAVPDAVVEAEVIRGELRSPPRSQTVTYVDVALIGEQFGVSYPAAAWRLLGLDLINSATADTLMKQTTAANRYLKEVKSLADDDSAPPMADADLRWQIFPLAIEAWRRELITEGRLREVATHLNFEDPEVAVELAELLM
jgi:transcriptional regulator with XRE-family HTH domain